MVSIRPRLREYLDTKGLTAYRLAQRVDGMKPASVYAIAAGKKRPSLESLEKILGALRELTGEPVSLADVLEVQGVVYFGAATLKGAATNTPPVPGSPESLLALAGALDDPDSPGDVSERHDHYLGLALEAEQRRILANSR